MKIKPLKQPNSSTCGPACIKMVAHFLGLTISMKRAIRLSGYKAQEGTSNEDIMSALKKLGLRVREKKNVAWGELRRSNKPSNAIIVSWMLNGTIGHVSVAEKVTATRIHLADSVKGKVIKLPKVDFMRLWIDYEPHWYPRKNTDIQLRWMAVVSKKSKT
ncbi:MAG: cysteine peptidase family C39 domain-containing protein [bacterium]|nr:cysteine peptidase family C39 domain-containing protein [bacterium]